MKILFGTGSLYNRSGGPFFSVKSTVHEIANKGHDVIVIGTKDDNAQKESPYVQKDKNNLLVKSFNKYGPYSLHYTPKVSTYLESLEGVDIASFQNFWLWNCAKAADYCIKNKIPYLIAPRGAMNTVALNVSSLKKVVAKFWFADKFMNAAHCFQALTTNEYQSIREYGVKQPIAIIPNGISIPKDKPPSKNQLPAFLEDKKIMLFLGRLHPIKNIENLLTAWATIDTNLNKNWHLVIAGSGNATYEQKLKTLVGNLKIEEHVYFPGFVGEAEKPKWFGNADAFILPSFSEGMPMAVLEAMSYQVPCILSSTCNIPEAYSFNAAIQCDTSSEEIGQAIVNMMSKEKDQIKAMRKNALDLVEQKFSWTIVANQLIEVYQWMAGQTKDIPKSIRLD